MFIFVVVLKHWQSDFAKMTQVERFYLYPTYRDLQGFTYNRLWSSFPFLHLADWPFLSCDTESVHVSGPGREKRGGEKRDERSASFLFSPGVFTAWLVKASTARYGRTLRNAGHARTISRVLASDGMPFQAPTGLSWPEILCCVCLWAVIFVGGSIWPWAANTGTAVLSSSHKSNQRWTHLLQRHKPHAFLLLMYFSRTFPLLLRLFQSGT